MTKPAHWIAAITAQTAQCRTRMPWERGLRRAAFIARRTRSPAVARPPMTMAMTATGRAPEAVLRAS